MGQRIESAEPLTGQQYKRRAMELSLMLEEHLPDDRHAAETILRHMTFLFQGFLYPALTGAVASLVPRPQVVDLEDERRHRLEEVQGNFG